MKRIVTLLLYLLIIGITSTNAASFGNNLLWDVEELSELRAQGPQNALYQSIITQADKYVQSAPIAVTDKSVTRSGDRHNFEALSVYTWPNPEDPNGPYIVRDGEYNPEYKLYDLPRLNSLADRMRMLSKAFYLTADERYYTALCKQLDVWFINRRTRMNPHFEYNQFIPGRNNGKGNQYGIIDAYNFIDVIEAIYLTEEVSSIGRRRTKAMMRWFGSFAEWMMTSEMGIAESKVANNHGTAYDVTLFMMCHFAGNDAACNDITSHFAERRINPQIEGDGRQPLELARTKAFFYSIFNLQHMVDFCVIQRRLGNDYLHNEGSKILSAIDYLQQFVGKESDFPYQEIGNWKEQEEELNHIIKKVK